MNTVTEIFGMNVFDDAVMKERLPEETYNQLQRTTRDGRHLDSAVADVVAAAMKDWAIEKGATHYTHWFQPMTGITAEKHDSFIFPAGDGKIIMEFSGKELIRGEPDASSFPNGGIRATFEARGYTAWDPNSFAFIKDNVLCIPTAFCSYTGEALDKKTPLLRSMEAISRQTKRILKLFGTEDTVVRTTVGAEQEYFLIDKEVYDRRKDIIFTGRTLFGAKPPKGQEMDDHYFGAIKPRVKAFMSELDEELWKLGILAKTEHNEAAPAQHELAPVFSTTNIAADHNQLTMELLQKVAKRHGMVCLLHEKPFKGVNGSGKHNNWSLSTDSGINLLNPGETPFENAQFLLFLCAVLKAVDDYQDLLRICVASAGNDHRLGAHEAPPAIVSVYLGDELTDILSAIENDEAYDNKEREIMKVGVHTLPRFPKDTTDRNRTSPFAFTGNKFEFRMLGSSASISDANVVINTTVAEELRQFADYLETSNEDFETSLHNLIKKVISEHKRIIFNGNGYDEAWVREAEKRGLLNLVSTPDCAPCLVDRKNIDLFAKHKVYNETELNSRLEIMLENYCKLINIEALTMVSMVKSEILPAVSKYSHELTIRSLDKRALTKTVNVDYETETAKRICELEGNAYDAVCRLDKALCNSDIADSEKKARFFRDTVFATMEELRGYIDELETVTASEYWPYPTYGDILFSIR